MQYIILFLGLCFVPGLLAAEINSTKTSPLDPIACSAAETLGHPGWTEARTNSNGLFSGNKPFNSRSHIAEPSEGYRIPVVFHVLGNRWQEFKSDVSVEAIQKALQHSNEDFNALNDDYASVDDGFISVASSIDIKLQLAQLDPQGNPTTGVVYYPNESGQGFGNYGGYDNKKITSRAWDNFRYMNIYIVLELEQPGEYRNSGVAWYPDEYMSKIGAARVVYNGRYLFGNTDKEFASVLTHEVGHWLNLSHTFEGSCSLNHPVDGSKDDFIGDTPAVDYSGMGCGKVLNCKNEVINSENYMDYNSTCLKMFTHQQVDRMKEALQHPARQPLWQPDNLRATGLLDSDSTSPDPELPGNEEPETEVATPRNPLAEFSYVCDAKAACNFKDLSDDDSAIKIFSWNFGDGSKSTLQNPSHAFKNPGYYRVSLEVTDNSNNSHSIEKNILASKTSEAENLSANQQAESGNKSSGGSMTWFLGLLSIFMFRQRARK